jgi:YD repeat-containing protein
MVVAQGQCVHCGFLIVPSSSASFGRRHPALLILIALFSLFLVAIAGTVVYRMIQASGLRRQFAEDQNRKKEFAVEHGNVVSPADLHAHGVLYFVPVGRQAIPVADLVDYYQKKFGIEITALSAVELPSSACELWRRQCIAEEVMSAMTNTYPEIARNPRSVMIALTDEDLFPRELGWNFTYSLHSDRIGVVSSRRMDPTFWGEPRNDAIRLAATKQMLTKYIAFEYFQLPDSFDQTSVLASPLTPDGGADDIYESDLHPEASANGQRGNDLPCLNFTYSYAKHEVRPEEPLLGSCDRILSPDSTDEEVFVTNLGLGRFVQTSLDIKLNSTPPIEFKRGYDSGLITQDRALGWGTDHSYNARLTSDGAGQLTFLNIQREDGSIDYFPRVPAGHGFDPNAVYESHDFTIYGARLTWDQGHYKLQYRNGDHAEFLPCSDSRCYWFGYKDTKGNSLNFDRGPHLDLQKLTASDSQGINFQADDRQRTTHATATDGTSVTYDYDQDGCLTRVSRGDGRVTLYEYDSDHQMKSISVIRSAGAAPETVLANEYDSLGRVVKQVVLGIGTYQIEYLATGNGHTTHLQLTAPGGEILNAYIQDSDFVVRSSNLRFPHKQE